MQRDAPERGGGLYRHAPDPPKREQDEEDVVVRRKTKKRSVVREEGEEADKFTFTAEKKEKKKVGDIDNSKEKEKKSKRKEGASKERHDRDKKAAKKKKVTEDTLCLSHVDPVIVSDGDTSTEVPSKRPRVDKEEQHTRNGEDRPEDDRPSNRCQAATPVAVDVDRLATPPDPSPPDAIWDDFDHPCRESFRQVIREAQNHCADEAQGSLLEEKQMQKMLRQRCTAVIEHSDKQSVKGVLRGKVMKTLEMDLKICGVSKDQRDDMLDIWNKNVEKRLGRIIQANQASEKPPAPVAAPVQKSAPAPASGAALVPGSSPAHKGSPPAATNNPPATIAVIPESTPSRLPLALALAETDMHSMRPWNFPGGSG
uniref:Uncharacterized protein n=1 Tax=Eutreptiella gymnastica TaxID=73025 RepID=A0A7S1IJ41_9EUGL